MSKSGELSWKVILVAIIGGIILGVLLILVKKALGWEVNHVAIAGVVGLAVGGTLGWRVRKARQDQSKDTK